MLLRTRAALLSFTIAAIVLGGGCDFDDAFTGIPRAIVRPANPLAVTASLDESRRASALIPAEGGSVTTAAADGTRFTLTIPEGALFNEETVSVTPVAVVDGLPLSGGLVGAVQLEPEGLRLMEFATLTIEGVGSVESVIGIAWLGTGEDFHLYPVEVSGSTITLPIIHFSGYGAGTGTAADVDQQSERVPESSESQFEQDLLVPLVPPVPDPDPATPEQIERLTRMILTLQLNRMAEVVAAALADPALLDRAVGEYVGWVEWLARIGRTEDFQQPIRVLAEDLQDAIAEAFDTAFQRCRGLRDPREGIRMAQLAKLAISVREKSGAAGQIQSPIQSIQQCLAFELVFISDLTANIEVGPIVPAGVLRSTVRTAEPVPLRLPLVSGASRAIAEGKGKLVYPLVRYTPRCPDPDGGSTPVDGTDVGSTGSEGILDARLVLLANLGTDLNRGIVLYLSEIFAITETLRFRCPVPPDGPPPQDVVAPTGGIWEVGFRVLHQDERQSTGEFAGTFRIKDRFGDWTFANGQWTKEYPLGRLEPLEIPPPAPLEIDFIEHLLRLVVRHTPTM